MTWANDFIGPMTPRDGGGTESAGARYWTDIVGVPFTRDATIDIPPTPVDLKLDGKPDTNFSAHWDLPGGILHNPMVAGLVPTPNDPAGTVGKYSVSTGFLGVREELDPQTNRGTHRFAFNCLLCHAGADEAGRVTIDRPNTHIYLGLIMAASRVMNSAEIIRDSVTGAPLAPDELRKREGLDGSFDLDPNHDGHVTIAEWRTALRMKTADETRAELLLAGPGRLDQSIDHRMDGNIPLAHLQHGDLESYGPQKYLAGKHAPKISVFNPLSLPVIHIGAAVAHYSWSGRDSSFREDAVRQIGERASLTPETLADALHCPHQGPVDFESLSRLLTLDLRNVSTYGLETDDVDGSAWPNHVLTNPQMQLLTDVPPQFGARELRELLVAPTRKKPESTDPLVVEGRRIFIEEACGEIINQRVTFGRDAVVPDAYRGIAVIEPIDRSRPFEARVPVQCATCHNYSPTSAREKLIAPLSDMQRCDVCHLDHPDLEKKGAFVTIAEHMRRQSIDAADDCLRCHAVHPAFGRQVYSRSWLLPFDANGNGTTFGDEIADAAAGGIGTDAYMNVDTNFNVQLRPPARRPSKQYLLTANPHEMPRESRFSQQGFGWVRVAPLIGIGHSEPYLHNGSVPTLDALLSPPADRPESFDVGWPEQKFTLSTRLPGNFNGGHLFGLKFTVDQKKALIAYLDSLP